MDVEVKRWHGTADNRVFGWQRMSVTDALRLQDETFRCPECLGKVRLHQASSENDAAAYGKHLGKNPGCSLGDCFDGVKRLHVKALN